MPGKEWTDEEVQKEIADAIAIVREDRFETFVRGRIGPANGNPDGGNGQSGNAGNDSGNPTATKKSRSLWWGEETE